MYLVLCLVSAVYICLLSFSDLMQGQVTQVQSPPRPESVPRDRGVTLTAATLGPSGVSHPTHGTHSPPTVTRAVGSPVCRVCAYLTAFVRPCVTSRVCTNSPQ